MLYLLIGFISGIVSGTGMGGGTILIFFLTFFMGVEQHVAQATNLIFFIPASLVAILVNLKNKNLGLKSGVIISIFGVLGAIIGANISLNIDVNILRKSFGIFLILTIVNGIYSVMKQNKKVKNKQ